MSSLDRVSHSAQWTRKKTPICDYPRLIAFGFSTPRSVYSTAYFLRKLGIVRRHLQYCVSCHGEDGKGHGLVQWPAL